MLVDVNKDNRDRIETIKGKGCTLIVRGFPSKERLKVLNKILIDNHQNMVNKRKPVM